MSRAQQYTAKQRQKQRVITFDEARAALVTILVRAKTAVIFGGVSDRMIYRHFQKFTQENMPTVYVEALTPLVICDEFSKAMLAFHFEEIFIAGLRLTVRKIELETGPCGLPTPLHDTPKPSWQRSWAWVQTRSDPDASPAKRAKTADATPASAQPGSAAEEKSPRRLRRKALQFERV